MLQTMRNKYWRFIWGAAMLSILFLTISVEVRADVVTENTNGKPFAIEGNGQLVDDAIDDDTKEFITVQTKNNQTYFVVIDRANSANNVYMLSMIDEDDLEAFLNDKDNVPVIDDISDLEALQEQTDSAEDEKISTQSSGSGVMMYVFLIIVIGGILGGYYYLKIYKPKQAENNAESENLEYGGYGEDSFEDDNEDEFENESENDYMSDDTDDNEYRYQANDSDEYGNGYDSDISDEFASDDAEYKESDDYRED